ncbi:Clathrin coatomer adaptor adaptin N terminal [Echinococcus multilocularis]|uniref:AP-3 complex subunit delta n=1 Tax=Echinococcus multilocularis TaxID=6211 RepID=A0A087VY40_ECHMU|nr:Clathrin coatomer adaptor adaptin N terminal [Echinococcus multilocularis]
MLGYDISWAAFNIIEVMSSSKFSHKRIGYLAASQCFGEQIDVLMLATNLIRKDLNSGKLYDTSVAISGLSCFVTPDLARDLCDDILALTASPKPYIARKAILLLYKVFLKNPDALRTAFPRLRKKLEDPDPGVQSAAVNVICELARKNPQNYLSLSPVFFKLMTTSTNNWVLIKIIKLFGALTPLEPRLGKKLIEPLTNLIHNTSAMSLLYECINTVLAGVPDHHASIQLCVQKLRNLIEDSDQNLKYLGLLAMGKILRHHPKSVQAHKDLILTCLDDRDESIRLRALDLLHGMVSRTNLLEIVRSLVRHLSAPEIGAHFRAELITTVVRICSQGNYQYVLSFEWYISVLLELAQLNLNRDGELLANQLLDVAVRVASVRPFAVSQMAIFLRSCKGMITHSNQASLHDVIYAAAWICGEYAGFLEEPRETLEAMLETANLVDLRGHIQSVLVLNSLKLYCKLAAKWFTESTNGCKLESPALEMGTSDPSLLELQALLDRLIGLTNFLMDKIALFVHSANLEVQERAVSIHQLLHLIAKRLSKLRVQAGDSVPNSTTTAEIVDLLGSDGDGQLDPLGSVQFEIKSCAKAPQQASPAHDLLVGLHALLYELCSFFEGELNPVAPKAQRKVPVPEGLDLDAWINEPPLPPSQLLVASPIALSSSQDMKSKKTKRGKNIDIRPSGDGIFSGLVEPEGPKPVQLSQAELDEMRKQRLLMQESNPHYLKPTKSTSHNLTAQDEVAIPTPSENDTPVAEPPSGGGELKLASSDEFAMEMQKQFKEMSKANAKVSGSRGKATKKGQRSRKAVVAEQAEGEETNEFPSNVTVSNVMDLPEGVTPNELDSPDEENDLDPTDPHRLLNIQLDIQAPETVATVTSSNEVKVKKRKMKVQEDGGERSKKDSTTSNGLKQIRDHHQPQQGISDEAFSKLLMGSTLTAACRVKVRCPATAEAVKGSTLVSAEEAFVALLHNLAANAGVSIVECVGTTASLYAEVAEMAVCVLVKLSAQTGSILIEAKSSQEASADEAVRQIKHAPPSVPPSLPRCVVRASFCPLVFCPCLQHIPSILLSTSCIVTCRRMMTETHALTPSPLRYHEVASTYSSNYFRVFDNLSCEMSQ